MLNWDSMATAGAVADIESVYVKQISGLDQPEPFWPIDLIDTVLA